MLFEWTLWLPKHCFSLIPLPWSAQSRIRWPSFGIINRISDLMCCCCHCCALPLPQAHTNTDIHMYTHTQLQCNVLCPIPYPASALGSSSNRYWPWYLICVVAAVIVWKWRLNHRECIDVIEGWSEKVWRENREPAALERIDGRTRQITLFQNLVSCLRRQHFKAS